MLDARSQKETFYWLHLISLRLARNFPQEYHMLRQVCRGTLLCFLWRSLCESEIYLVHQFLASSLFHCAERVCPPLRKLYAGAKRRLVIVAGRPVI